MSGKAVSNSACIISLERIGQLAILPAVFTEIAAPSAVVSELGVTVPWLVERPLAHPEVAAVVHAQVGRGEAEALALAEHGARDGLARTERYEGFAGGRHLRMVSAITQPVRLSCSQPLPSLPTQSPGSR